MLNWKHPQPISKKKWNERMSQHRSEEFYSRPASQRWASWCDWSQAIKSCGGPHKLAPQPPHCTVQYSLNYTLCHTPPQVGTTTTTTFYAWCTIHYAVYFLTATSWHEPQVLLRHPQVSTHSQVLAPLLLLISLIFCGNFLSRSHRPHILSKKEKLFAKLQTCLMCVDCIVDIDNLKLSYLVEVKVSETTPRTRYYF